MTASISLLKAAAKGLDRARRVVTWACALSPAAALLVFASLGSHVRLALGHWPKPMWEHYNTAAYRAHELAFVGVCVFVIYAAGPLWLVFVALPGQRLRWKTLAWQLGACGLSWLLICLVGTWDPTRFASWFLD